MFKGRIKNQKLFVKVKEIYHIKYHLRFHDNKVPEIHEKHDDTSPGSKLIGFQCSLRFLIWLALLKNHIKFVVTI